MAEEAQPLGALLVHLSTDYVFNGVHYTPYVEGDVPAPTNVYGASKLAGEDGIRQACPNHIIMRTAWVYGTRGKGNFAKTMLRLGAEREEVRVVADQIGTPTFAGDIADAIVRLVGAIAPGPSLDETLLGTYHFTNSGVASWYDFAIAIFEEAKRIGFPLKLDRVVPITTAEHPTPASRPAYSVLSCCKINAALGTVPPHWRQSLGSMLLDLYSQTY
jgi:dTDP-4-dehydrorhamnose reductase